MSTNAGLAAGTVDAIAKRDRQYLADAVRLKGKAARELDRIGLPPQFGNPDYVVGRRREVMDALAVELKALEDAHAEDLGELRPHGLQYVEAARQDARETFYKANATRWDGVNQAKVAARRPAIVAEVARLSAEAILDQFKMAVSVNDTPSAYLYQEIGLPAMQAAMDALPAGEPGTLSRIRIGAAQGKLRALVDGDAGQVRDAALREAKSLEARLKAPATSREHLAMLTRYGVNTTALDNDFRPIAGEPTGAGGN